MTTQENYFIKLSTVKCVIEKKKELSYVSWADAWSEVKKLHPDATYTIYETLDGFPFWESIFGIDVKVGVTINGIEHISRLPVMDGANKAMKREAYKYKTKQGERICEAADAFDINKAIQRAFTKAIAMHGIGLYVYRGEDLPNDVEDFIDPEIVKKDLFNTFKVRVINIQSTEELSFVFEEVKKHAKQLGQKYVTEITTLIKEQKAQIEASEVFENEDEDEDQTTVEGYIADVESK